MVGDVADAEIRMSVALPAPPISCTWNHGPAEVPPVGPKVVPDSMPLLPEPAVKLPLIDFVNAPMIIGCALPLSIAQPDATSITVFGLVPSFESVRPER